MRSFINISVFLLLPVVGWSQGNRLRDTLQLALDTIKQYRYIPTGVRVGVDVISPIQARFQDDFSGWEVTGDVDFHRYYLAVDVGHWARSFSEKDTSVYNNSGTYWRIGADVNFLTKDPDRNMFFIGLRYGRSRFTENLSVISSHPVWGTVQRDYSNNNISAGWLELTSGIKVKMWKVIWMGYTARFKFGLSTDRGREMLPHDVPGYGRTDRDTYWGFNYYIMVRIPFRKTLTIPSLKL